MIEKSPYTGSSDTKGGMTCFGRITSVDAAARTCRVKTYGMVGVTDALDLINVKFLHLAWHAEGDEDVYIPRVGSYGVILFINSEPYIVGYLNLSNLEGGGGRANQEPLIPGDKTTATIGGNRITLRSGGTIQIESTKGCYTYFIPSEDVIASVCKNWELETSGGYLKWNVDRDTSDTRMKFFAWDNLVATTGMLVDVGATEDGAMLDIAVGTLNEDLALAERKMQLQVDKDGTTYLEIGPGKMSMKIDPNGNIELMTQGNITSTVKGNVTQNVDGNVSMKVKGTTTIDSDGKVTVKTGADAEVTASGNVNVKGSKITLNGESSGITTANSHQNVVDFITGVPVQPSQTVFGDV